MNLNFTKYSAMALALLERRGVYMFGVQASSIAMALGRSPSQTKKYLVSLEEMGFIHRFDDKTWGVLFKTKIMDRDGFTAKVECGEYYLQQLELIERKRAIAVSSFR